MLTLGLIPSWQFSSDPQENSMINPHISMPPSILQAGVWSSQPVLNGNLGYVMVDEGTPFQMPAPLGYWIPSDWVWEHRKPLAIGVGALAILGLVAILR